MENDRQLPGHGDLGLLEADAFPQPVTPGFERAPLRHPGEQHAGGLEEVDPDHRSPHLEIRPAPIDLARGMAARCQPEVGADAPGTSEAAGSSIAEWKAKAVIGPIPGTVMERLTVFVVARQGQQLAMKRGDLSTDASRGPPEGANGLPQTILLAKQLFDPAAEDIAARLADDAGRGS